MDILEQQSKINKAWSCIIKECMNLCTVNIDNGINVFTFINRINQREYVKGNCKHTFISTDSPLFEKIVKEDLSNYLSGQFLLIMVRVALTRQTDFYESIKIFKRDTLEEIK